MSKFTIQNFTNFISLWVYYSVLWVAVLHKQRAILIIMGKLMGTLHNHEYPSEITGTFQNHGCSSIITGTLQNHRCSSESWVLLRITGTLLNCLMNSCDD